MPPATPKSTHFLYHDSNRGKDSLPSFPQAPILLAIVLCVIQNCANFQVVKPELPKSDFPGAALWESFRFMSRSSRSHSHYTQGDTSFPPYPPLTRERVSRSLPWIPLCGTLYLHGEACAASPSPTAATLRCIFSRTFLTSELICMSSFLMVAVKAIALAPLVPSPPLRSFILW